MGNWKMNGDTALLQKFSQLSTPKKKLAQPCLAVPFVLLEQAYTMLGNKGWLIGAQDVSEHETGAYTGCISAKMLANASCDFSLVGHSERRIYQGEHNEQIAAKIQQLNANSITPVVCIGENLQQQQNNQTELVIASQLEPCLEPLKESKNAIVAYEPVWAIGTGKSASPAQAKQVHNFIRKILDNSGLKKLKILYGGSVNADNIAPLLAHKNINGALVGGTSLQSQSWQEMVEQIK